MNDTPLRRAPHGGLPSRRRRWLLGRTRRSVAHPPSGPAPLPLDPGRLRDACLPDLPPEVRVRLERMAGGTIQGGTIQWWADRYSPTAAGPVHAVFLGRRALAVAMPVDYDPGALAYELTEYVLGEPAATELVRYRPAPRQPREPGYRSGPGLAAESRRLLANLPPRAQYLLQRPLLGHEIERCDWHYESTGNPAVIDMFMVHLASARMVTAAFGSRWIPSGHTAESAHWSLRVIAAHCVRQPTFVYPR